jgi:hypothetical protein
MPGIFVLVQKDRYKKTVIPKKKVIAARNHKDCLPSFTTQNKKSKKRKTKFFNRDTFVLP